MKTSKAQFTVSTRVVNLRTGMSPDTEIMEIKIVRNDGAKFSITEAFGDWHLTGGKPCPVTGSTSFFVDKWYQAAEWCRLHNLPSLRYMEDEYNKQRNAYADDPMGTLES